MNSNYGRSNNKSSSINAFDFDLGLGSGRAKSMNDQKNQTSSYSSTAYNYSSAQQKPNTKSSWTHQPDKPAWTHQPAPSTLSGVGSLSGPTSMVGDILGKSWNSSAPSNSSSSGVGIVNNKNPNLFGDLLSSAMGQSKSSSNVPLKNAAPASNQSTFSMGGMADSLPKTGTNSSGGNVNLGNDFNRSSTVGGGNVNLGSNFRSSTAGSGNVNLVGNNNRNPNLGGPSMKGMAGNGVGGGGLGANKDPFVSLVDFGSKPLGGMKSETKASDKSDFGNDPFGEFQNATAKTSTSSFSSNAFPTSKSDPLDDFMFSNSQTQSQNQPSGKSSGTNDFDALFSSSSDGGLRGSEEFTSQQFTSNDWGINDEFGGGNDTGGTTTEIEGLPPPPAGVTAPSAKNKGMDNYKQGQFADAIKWLSWAVVLLEKAGDDAGTMEVLTCRASCYKEVGEYKKAVADCTKVLDHDAKNVSVLVQRALLYESMEKYKLGAEDLRTVMKLDPGNRVARSTIHRLTKMAG